MKGVKRFGKKGKLSSRYVGPFWILSRFGKVAYEIKFPSDLASVHQYPMPSPSQKPILSPSLEPMSILPREPMPSLPMASLSVIDHMDIDDRCFLDSKMRYFSHVNRFRQFSPQVLRHNLGVQILSRVYRQGCLRVQLASSSSTGGTGSACGACKFLRRKCVVDSIFAPYFNSEEGPSKFAAIYKVFGVNNVSKLLHNVPVDDLCDAVVTTAYEAQAKIKDPAYGCVANIFSLQQLVLH
ncbi:LOB domain-containing protein 16 [Capsicum chinense]|nr:LOB domain-containing protein 16 [Capsicum chinense]